MVAAQCKPHCWLHGFTALLLALLRCTQIPMSYHVSSEFEMRRLGPYDCFGEHELLEGLPRRQTARCLGLVAPPAAGSTAPAPAAAAGAGAAAPAAVTAAAGVLHEGPPLLLILALEDYKVTLERTHRWVACTNVYQHRHAKIRLTSHTCKHIRNCCIAQTSLTGTMVSHKVTRLEHTAAKAANNSPYHCVSVCGPHCVSLCISMCNAIVLLALMPHCRRLLEEKVSFLRALPILKSLTAQHIQDLAHCFQEKVLTTDALMRSASVHVKESITYGLTWHHELGMDSHSVIIERQTHN